METHHINEHHVEFDPDTHSYFVDGKKVPSVTQIIEAIHPRKTSKADPDVLKKAAERGNQLRTMIKAYEDENVKTYHPEMHGYLALKTQHQIHVLNSDVIVLLHQHGIVIGAGRFNMVVQSPFIKGKGIADVKRRLHLDEGRLLLQLNLYKLAYEQTYKQKIRYLKCMHIRNRYHRYVDIPVHKQEAQALLDKYTEKHPIDYQAWF